MTRRMTLRLSEAEHAVLIRLAARLGRPPARVARELAAIAGVIALAAFVALVAMWLGWGSL